MDDIIRLGEIFPSFVLVILTAIVCGSLIGLERGIRKSGALTYIVLICVGSALFISIGELAGVGGLSVETGTITGHVITAIALIGSALIIANKGESHGIYMAVALWVAGAIGVIVGLGHHLLALFVTGVIVTLMTLLYPAQLRLAMKAHPLLLKLTIRSDTEEIRLRIRELLEKYRIQTDSMRVEQSANGVKVTIHGVEEPKEIRTMVSEFWSIQGVLDVEH